MSEPSSYDQQKKYFTNRKQLRVWVELEKYQRFEAAVKGQKPIFGHQSVYRGVLRKGGGLPPPFPIPPKPPP